MSLNKWNKLIGFSVVVGCLVSGCICFVLPASAGEPGADVRPTERGFIPMREIPREETSSVALPAGAPTDPALFREWREYERDRRRHELEMRRQEHREQLEQRRWEQQQQREQERYQYQQQRRQERYQYQQYRNQARYGQYGYSGGGYGGGYYPSYAPPVPIPIPMYEYHSYRPRYRDYGHCHGSHFGVHIGF